MKAKLHDANGNYLQDTALGFYAPDILTLPRERQPIPGTLDFIPRRLIKFRLRRIEGDLAIYHEIGE